MATKKNPWLYKYGTVLNNDDGYNDFGSYGNTDYGSDNQYNKSYNKIVSDWQDEKNWGSAGKKGADSSASIPMPKSIWDEMKGVNSPMTKTIWDEVKGVDIPSSDKSSTDIPSVTSWKVPIPDSTQNDNSILDKLKQGYWNFENSADKFVKDNPITSFLAKAGQSAANTMTNGGALNDNYDTGSWLANGAADLIGTGVGFAERLPGTDFSIGNAMNKVIGKPVQNTLQDVATKYGANNKLSDYTIQALKTGAEFGGYQGLSNASQGKDIGQGIAEGMGQGMLWGIGGKAVGDAFSHFVPGIGKAKVLGEEGNNVIIQDEQGNKTPMNKTIFNTTAQKIPQQTIDNINFGNDLKGYSPQELRATKNFNNDLIDARNYGAENTKDSLGFSPEEGNSAISNEIRNRLGANGGTKYTVKNTAHEKAIQDYQDAIEIINNHFGTNKLTPEEVARIKPELGIDIQQLLSNIDNAKTDVGKIGERQRLRQIANVDNTAFHPTNDGFSVPQDTKYPNQKMPSLINPKKATESVNGKGNINIPSEENAQQIPSISDIIKSKQPDILNTDYSKVNDIDTLNNHISKLQDTIKSTTDETKLKAMNLQLFAAQARLQKLKDIVRPDIEAPGSKILFNGKKDKFSFKNSLDSFKNSLNNAYTRMVDENKPTSDFSKVSGDEAYIKSINSKNVGGVIDNILQNSLVDMQGNKIGFSLKQLVKQIPKKQQEKFWEYMMHRHNVDRAAADKNIYMNYDSKASKNAVEEFEKLNPNLKKAGDNITKWLNKFMGEWGNKSGLISDDLWKSLQKQYPNYIPTNRIFDELEKGFDKTNGKGFVDQTSPLSRAKGSDKDIDNPIVNIMKVVNRTVRTAKYNEVGQDVLKSLREKPDELKRFAEIIPVAEKGKKYVLKNLGEITVKSVDNDNVTVTKNNTDYQMSIKKFKEANKTKTESLERDNIVRVLENGEPVHIRINNKLFLDSLKAINKSNVGDIEGVAKKATNIFKALITTKNPLFALTNAARDLPTYLVNSKENNPLVSMWNLGGAYKDILTNGETYKKYKGVGGGGANFFNSEKPYKSAKDLTGNGILPMLNGGIESFNNIFENAPRLAEFKRTLKKTGDVNKALYDSSEVTTNFARGGDITKHIDSFVPYLNAGVQGLDKLARQFKTPKSAIATILKGATVVSGPTLLLNHYNKNNENYKKLDNRTKDNYYLIPNGDKFIKIPKSRELGVVFGSLLERILRKSQGDYEAFKGFGNTVATNFSPSSPVENNILAPLIYNIPSNKDFADRAIVPQTMVQDQRSPYLQYDEKTSEIAKKLGELTGYSPKKVDYIIKSYTGVIGQFLQPLTTKSTTTGSKKTDLLSPFTSKFTADPLYNNQAINDFYDNMGKTKTAATDNNIINNIDSKETTSAEHLASEFTKANKTISDLTKASFEALQNGDMDKVKELRQKIIDTATSTNKYMPIPGQDTPELPTPASEIKANVEGRLKGKKSTESTQIRKEIKTIDKSDMSAEERTQKLNDLLDSAQNAPTKKTTKTTRKKTTK